jgi:putative hemolysin
MENKASKFIDIEAILKDKNPRLYKLLPRFVINYIKRTLHEDFINEGIEVYKDAYHLEFNQAALQWMGIQVGWSGIEHVPETGGVIIASNHPLGGLDGIALIKAVSQRRKDIRFLVNDILTRLVNFQTLFVAVNKVGVNSKEALKIIDEVYAGDEAVLIFPAGLVSRKQKGKVADLEWKKSFISKSLEYKKDIVPAYIDGNNSQFFYNLSLWRKRFGIKSNVEMFYLVDEMVKQKGKTINVFFGKSIPYETFDKRHSHQDWALIVRKYVYTMRDNVNLDFNEFYEQTSLVNKKAQ